MILLRNKVFFNKKNKKKKKKQHNQNNFYGRTDKVGFFHVLYFFDWGNNEEDNRIESAEHLI